MKRMRLTLARKSDGAWSGKAMDGGAMVDVQAHDRGNVMFR
ncbi:hypothetical protein BH11PSE3_BH11PSE3_19540 [soil metagenome]